MRQKRLLLFSVLIVFCSLWTGCASARMWQKVKPPKNRDIWVENNTIGATAKLIIQKLNGAYSCTAWAIERQGNLYQFITDSHCVTADVDGKIIIESGRLELHWPNGKPGIAKRVYPAEIIGVGYLGVDDDFAILQADLGDKDIPTLELAEKPPLPGQCLFTVGFPQEAFGHLFYGFVDKIDKKTDKIYFRVDGITNPGGASGSALVDCESGEVFAIWVGGKEGVRGYYLAFSISKFKKFREALENDTYKYYKKDKKFKEPKKGWDYWNDMERQY